MNNPSTLRRIWLLTAQVIAISTGVLVAWRSYGPVPVTASAASVVSVRETTPVAIPASSDAAARLEAGFHATANKASASVVNMYTRKTPPQRPEGRWRPYGDSEQDPAQGQSSLGSGVIVAAQGYILTNKHVIAGADEIAVMLPDGKLAQARLIGTDPETDLAVLRVASQNLQPIVIADPASVQVGDIVLAEVDPFGIGQTVTQGIFSATVHNRLGNNTFENFIQTDAAMNLGNFGGVLADTAGHLIGINTAIYSRSGGSQGIDFAIPVSLARQVIEQIISTGRVARGWLGVSARDVVNVTTGLRAGAALVCLLRDGPAYKAGLHASDTVVAINDKEISDTAPLVAETAALSPGTRTQFKVVRDDQSATITVELGQRPAERTR